MPMNEVILNKKHAGQKESNEKVGSSVVPQGATEVKGIEAKGQNIWLGRPESLGHSNQDSSALSP